LIGDGNVKVRAGYVRKERKQCSKEKSPSDP